MALSIATNQNTHVHHISTRPTHRQAELARLLLAIQLLASDSQETKSSVGVVVEPLWEGLPNFDRPTSGMGFVGECSLVYEERCTTDSSCPAAQKRAAA